MRSTGRETLILRSVLADGQTTQYSVEEKSASKATGYLLARYQLHCGGFHALE